MDRITLSVEYYNLLKRLRKKSEREVVAMAIFEFAFEGIEPKDLSEASEIAFEGIRQSLEKSRNNGGRGGRKKKNRIETDLKPIDNQFKTELLPIENRIETEIEKNKEKKAEQKKDNKKDKATPLFISPQSGDEKTPADEFYAKYPRYAKDRDKMRADVDYKRLVEEFDKSTYLRSLYTVKQINEIYPCILTGDYRDQEKKPSSVVDADARADRERWYAERRQKALGDAEKIYKTFLKDETFAKIDKRLRVIACEQGKAEARDDKTTLAKLEREKARLSLQKRGIIERNGMTEEDLEPKWNCKKCQDTGFVDGIPCDCYEGA